MIYYTDDIHGSIYELTKFCYKMNLSESDIIVILGDVGANYYGGKRDCEFKEAVSLLKPTIFCIHGNHEKRPAIISSYKLRSGTAVRFGMKRTTPSCCLQKKEKASLWVVCSIW